MREGKAGRTVRFRLPGKRWMGTRNSRGSAGLTEKTMSSVWLAESLSCWWAFLVQMAARLLEGQWFKLSDLMG